MSINIKASPYTDREEKFIDLTAVGNNELKKIDTYLKLVLLALEAIADISDRAIIQATLDLHLESEVGEQIATWRMQSSHLQNYSVEGLNLEKARSLTRVICYLANRHQELLRRGICLLEQCEPDRPLHQFTLLDSYLTKFIDYYQTRIDPHHISTEFLSDLAWKLLSDLLFYSGYNGHRLLWLALIDAARVSATSPS